MQNAERIGPIARFLGTDAALGGPAALLGLNPDRITDEQIIAARDRRLGQIDQHPQAGSAAADEVRLAIHAATAQLLNPTVRTHLATARAVDARRAAMLAFEHDMILTLGMFGGWSRRCLPRLLALAHARGLTASDVAVSLSHLSRRRRAVATPSGVLAPGAGELDGISTRSTGGGWIIISVAIISVLIASLVIREAMNTAVYSTSPPTTALQPGQMQIPIPTSPIADAAASPMSSNASVEPLLGPREVITTFDRANALAMTDIEASRALAVRAVQAASIHWLVLMPDERVRITDAVIDLLYLHHPASAAAILSQMEDALAPLRLRSQLTVENLPPAAWSAGMLNRIRRERDLPSQINTRVDRALSTALRDVVPTQSSFEEGVLAALMAMVDSIASANTPSDGVWNAWVRSLEQVSRTDSLRRAQLLMHATDRVLMTASDPQQRSTYNAIRELMRAMPWRESIESRRWAVRQFDNRDVPSAALSAVTQAIVADSRAENVDPTMVLAANASDLGRRELRDRYAAAWGLDSPGEDRALLDSLRTTGARIDHSLASAKNSVDTFAAAVRYARLNAAAATQWQGNVADAHIWLESANSLSVDQLRSRYSVQTIEESYDWAVRYIAAGAHIEQRLELLHQLRARGGGSIGAVDAEVLVREALRGNVRAIRLAATEVVHIYSASPAVVNALLEEAPRFAPTRASNELVASLTFSNLPNPNSPTWRASVRRVLVERLIELTVGQSPSAVVDDLAILLEEVYQQQGTSRTTSSGEQIKLSATQSARALRERWVRLAERSVPPLALSGSLESIERARLGRLTLARGPVQEFHVEQVALVGTMGYVIACERPGVMTAVESVMSEFESVRRTSTHIFEQIAAGERAIAALWRIRFGDDE